MNVGDVIPQLVRIEREMADLGEDRKSLLAAAKEAGISVTALRRVVRAIIKDTIPAEEELATALGAYAAIAKGVKS